MRDRGPTYPPGPPPPPPAWTEEGSPSWQGDSDDPAPGRRRLGPLLVAPGGVVVLIAGVVVFRATGSGSTESTATAIALSFRPRQDQTYRINMNMQGSFTAGGYSTESLTMNAAETVSWKVASVDGKGVATIKMIERDFSGRVNTERIPASKKGLSTTMRIAPDGQILSVNGVTFSGSAQASGVDYPGTDQMTPILADGPVEPGDSWQKTFSQESPFGQGKLQYTARARPNGTTTSTA